MQSAYFLKAHLWYHSKFKFPAQKISRKFRSSPYNSKIFLSGGQADISARAELAVKSAPRSRYFQDL